MDVTVRQLRRQGQSDRDQRDVDGRLLPGDGGRRYRRSGPLAVLTTAGQIKRLKREEALRGYPVLIRGVITCVEPEYRAGWTYPDLPGGFARRPLPRQS
ncbi:MAG TPA: hypothetical protein VNT26_14070, partial [Candidatus Sulfotelmatobacter sp.]|nr:hypothetical protein [Candidatus Sulfotelmatobacter sp.]